MTHARLVAVICRSLVVTVIVGRSLVGAPAAGPPVTEAELPLLTRVEEVRNLSPEEADRHYPVRLRGVVLDYTRRARYYMFVHDGTASIFIEGAKNNQLQPGVLVQVEGESGAGGYAPTVHASKLRILGKGELPAPRDVSFDQLASGAEDGQWVRVEGIVRAARVERLQDKYDWPTVEIVMKGGGRLHAMIGNYRGEEVGHFVDATVSMTGASLPYYNRRRQLLNVRLAVPAMDFVTIAAPAPAEPFAGPVRPINTLLQFSPKEAYGHRVKVEGTVLFQQPGEALFIRDATRAIYIKTSQHERVAPGDRVEVLGFPLLGEYSPLLEDAMFHKIAPASAPEPLALAAEQARRGEHDAELIRLEGQLIDQFHAPGELVLVLQDKETIFRAHLAQPTATEPVRLRNGSSLQLTGICVAQLENNRWPQSFRLLVRSPADILVRTQPPWLTLQRMIWAFAGLLVVLLAAMISIVVLRRRIAAQAGILARKVQREAVLEERTRIAREFHDTLEQELAGIRMQLEVVADKIPESPDDAKSKLDVAQAMIRHSQSEARCSVWDLRARALENGTLPDALSQIASFAKNGSTARIEVSVSGVARSLPARVENQLLRIGQEAITNALKHGRPEWIRVELAYDSEAVRLSISDDGCGFRADDVTSTRTGHFGLRGMRERATKIGAHLHITSALGAGTAVEINVPLGRFAAERNPA